MEKSPLVSRRTLLKAVPAAAAVLAVPEGLLTRQRAAADAFTFPQPPVWSSPTRVLDRRLDVRFTENEIPNFGRTLTRTYNAMIPGPTLRLRGGDTLRLTQFNHLPPNEPFNGDHNTPHDFNTFNLHTHGLHVSPAGDADNIFREFDPADPDDNVAPHYVSTIDIPANHPAGTFWYHPHNHGSVSTQLAGGMAGVLIVEGDVDRVPEIAAAADVVVCINELKVRDGMVPVFDTDGAITSVPSTFTVNGTVNPVITMRPGEVQRWRLVAATGFTRLVVGVAGDGAAPDLFQIAQDGVTFPAPVAKTEIPLGMGNRADVLVRAAEPGLYALRSGDTQLMTVVVTGTPVYPPMALPRTLPPGKPFLDPRDVTDVDFVRRIEFNVATNAFPEDPDFPNAYRILGTHPTPPEDPDDLLHDPRYGRFDPDYVNHTLGLGRVERWIIGPTVNHPFHLHTNHFMVTHQNGVPLNPPVWQDTLSSAAESTILVRYEDFTGLAVLHCHNLKHEDLGMMQVIDYV